MGYAKPQRGAFGDLDALDAVSLAAKFGQLFLQGGELRVFGMQAAQACGDIASRGEPLKIGRASCRERV